MSRVTNQRVILWLGYSFVIVYIIGFVLIANFIPPHSPTFSNVDVAKIFHDKHGRILVGQSLCVIASALYLPWSVAIFCQMLRVETKDVARVPAFSLVQVAAGSIGSIFFMLPSMIWVSMAFHTQHAGDYLRLMDDFAWFIWFISTPLFIVQELALGACILAYKQNVFPRWVGWYCLMSPISLIPVCWVALFHTGPFAWNGMVGFYIPITLYMIWFHVVTFSVRNGIRKEAAESDARATAGVLP